MTSITDSLERALRKYETRTRLEDADRQAFLSLPFKTRAYEAHHYIGREGDRAPDAKLILDGLAYRHKVTINGARQILSLHIPGDFVDLESALLKVADHSVQALTDCGLAVVPRAAIIDMIENHPRLAHAMWIDTLIDASVYREWILNVGRRESHIAMCHLLCEFTRRLEMAGLARREGYFLPMTQEQLADALGITPVHVNRVLRDLDARGLVIRDKRFLRIPDWEALRKAAGFNELYLHLDTSTANLPAGDPTTVMLGLTTAAH